MSKRPTRTRGARILGRILDENGALARSIRARIDKAVLWRLRTGARGPSAETGPLLEHLTRGQIRTRDFIAPERWRELVKG